MSKPPRRAIFLSYRRDDSAGEGGLLFRDLTTRFGKGSVFIDRDITIGVPFPNAIDEGVAGCRVLLAVIGKNWLEAKDEKGRRRIEDPADFVRRETVLALKSSHVNVVPVLVHGARMPRADQMPEELRDLAYRNASELTAARWDYDMQVLVKQLREIISPNPDSNDYAWVPSPCFSF